VTLLITFPWHRHDANAIVAAYAEGGVYINPDVPDGLTGAAIGDFANAFFTIFSVFLMHGVIHADLPGIEVTNIDPCAVALP
jgi:hypothetical protein